jgi:predicted nuclease with TOPRIM domain
MTTATKTRKAKELEQPVSFAEINARKIREKIEAYRGYVERAVDGELLDEKQLEEVGEILAFLLLPDMCWERDIRALRDYRETAAAAEELAGKQPQYQLEASELVAKVKQLEAELRESQTRLNYLARVAPRTQANEMQRQNELRSLHPHLLLDLEHAVALRAEAKAKTHAKQVPAKTLEGWSK